MNIYIYTYTHICIYTHTYIHTFLVNSCKTPCRQHHRNEVDTITVIEQLEQLLVPSWADRKRNVTSCCWLGVLNRRDYKNYPKRSGGLTRVLRHFTSACCNPEKQCCGSAWKFGNLDQKTPSYHQT